MPFENVNGNTVITGERSIKLAQMMVWKSGLGLELAGMSRRGRSMFAIIKAHLHLKGSKQKVYDQLTVIIERNKQEYIADREKDPTI